MVVGESLDAIVALACSYPSSQLSLSFTPRTCGQWKPIVVKQSTAQNLQTRKRQRSLFQGRQHFDLLKEIQAPDLLLVEMSPLNHAPDAKTTKHAG